MGRLKAAIKKEFLQFLRDRMLILLIVWTYTVEVVMCTMALSFEVKNLHMAVYDTDRSQWSQKLVERFTSTEYFTRALYVSSLKEMDGLLDSGQVDMGLVIPPDFSEAVGKGRRGDLQIILSGTNSNTANTARGYAGAIIEGFSRDAALESLRRTGLRAEVPEVEPEVRVWYNPELKFRYFMIVSMIVVAGMMIGMIHPAATMVREKETGTIEQIMLTPLRRHEVILAKLLPTVAISMLSLIPSLLIASGLGLPVKGSIVLFFLASAIFLFTSMGIGVFISTLSKNLQQALLISFFILFPIMFLSGTVVPVESMPLALQYLSYLSPVRYYMEIALGIFLKGIGLGILWPKLLAIFLFGAVIFPLSLLRLKRRMYE
ncbi:MAG: ABC transporter permease [Deltaproteobacteria bacterium]|nr:ABC transporter permease [Deltaproteobacteria bacterium]